MKVLDQIHEANWSLYHGDCIEVVSGLPSESIDYSLFSPPFQDLYVYSNSVRDAGNCRSAEEFQMQMRFLFKELYRVLVPGRNVSFHCMNLPASKQNDGYIGIKNFRDQLIRMFQDEGFILHSEVVIHKNPVTAMQRTKALGLLHKQLVKDSAMSRQGIPDYLITMRKPGENPKPVQGELEYYVGDPANAPHPSGDKTKDSINVWQRYADPTFTDVLTKFEEIIPTLNPEQLEVFAQLLYLQTNPHSQEIWTDINPSKTLQKESARDNRDERHVCPLQLQVIERALQLWTNPGDRVLDPFNGIGSTGHVCLQMPKKRRYIGVELKESYFKAAKNNLYKAASQQTSLLDLLPV